MEDGQHSNNLELRNWSEILIRCFVSTYYQEEKQIFEDHTGKLRCQNPDLKFVFDIALTKTYGLKNIVPYLSFFTIESYNGFLKPSWDIRASIWIEVALYESPSFARYEATALIKVSWRFHPHLLQQYTGICICLIWFLRELI